MSIEGFKLKDGTTEKYDYEALDNLPVIPSGHGLSDGAKQALLTLLGKVAYIDGNGQTYYDALETALYPPANLVSISAVYTQSGTVYDTGTLDSLKSGLVVTAHYDDSTSEAITTYTLSGTLTEGTSTITVAYGGKTATFSVTVTHWEPVSVTVTFTGSGADKTSNIFDATQYDAYYELPFVDGASEYKEGVTETFDAFVIYDVFLYNDAEGADLAGRYQVDTGTIAQSGRPSGSLPKQKFNTKLKIAPHGYYVKFILNKCSASFENNSDFMSYIQAYGNKVTLE